MDRNERAETGFRETLRTERERRGWSQADVARMLRDRGVPSMHPTTVAKIEAGERSIRLEEAAAVADLFNASVDSLLGRRPGLKSDLAFVLRALQDAAGQYVLQVGSMMGTLGSKGPDLAAFDFEGRDAIAAEAQRALDALGQAQNALYRLSTFELAPGAAVTAAEDVIEREVRARLQRLIERVTGDETQP